MSQGGFHIGTFSDHPYKFLGCNYCRATRIDFNPDHQGISSDSENIYPDDRKRTRFNLRDFHCPQI